MHGLRLAALAVVVAAAGCGGGGGRTVTRRSYSTSPARAPSGPADIPAMRALLARFSPTSHHVLTHFDALPRRFEYGRTTSTLSFDKGFGEFFPDGAVDELVGNMATAVHEVYHSYATVLGYHLMVEAGLDRGDGVEGVYVGAEPILVQYSPIYPAREMDATYPADARTARYAVYVSPSREVQSTQQDGVFGLLDEWTAYYHGARTKVDLWPWLRDESPGNEQLLVNYTAKFHEMWVPYAEFKLFILHYLLHARTHRPDVYRALIANPSFRRAYAAVDAAWSALLDEAGALEPTVHAFARDRGLAADLIDGQLTYDGSPFTIRDDAYPAVLRHLASAPYRELAADLAVP